MTDKYKGVIKVVGFMELEKHTEDGWELVEVLKADSLTMVPQEVPHPQAGMQSPNGIYNPETMTVQAPVSETHYSFLLKRGAETLVSKLKGKVLTLNEQLEGARMDADGFNKMILVLRETDSKQVKELAEKDAFMKKVNDNLMEANTENAALQLKIDKVTESIGTAQFLKIMNYED